MATTPYAELHAHTNFSFLDGASAPDDLVERAVARGLTALAATDRNGLYGAVRFMGAAEEAGLHGVVGTEIELLDPAVPDPDSVVIPPRRRRRRRADARAEALAPVEGRPVRPRPTRAKLPGHRDPVKEDYRGIGSRARGPHLVLLARTPAGWRSLSRIISRANMAGTKAVPRFRHELLEDDHDDVVALSGCRDGEIARRLRVGDRAGARATAERYGSIIHNRAQFRGDFLPDCHIEDRSNEEARVPVMGSFESGSHTIAVRQLRGSGGDERDSNGGHEKTEFHHLKSFRGWWTRSKGMERS